MPQRSLSGEQVKTFDWHASGSSQNEDALEVAEYIAEERDIGSYTVEQLATLVKAGMRVGEFKVAEGSRTKRAIAEPLKWFDERIKPNTIELCFSDYENALANALYDILVSELDRSDFISGGNRQREFGQMLTNTTRGYLAEFALTAFLSQFDEVEETATDQGRSAPLDETKGSDIVGVKKQGDEELRSPDKDLQIKMSKLGSMWLTLDGKDENDADYFVKVRVGLPFEHLASFLEEKESLVDALETIPDEKAGEIRENISDIERIPVHIAGFASWEEFEEGEVVLDEKEKWCYVVGGIGMFPREVKGFGDNVKLEGIGTPSQDFVAAHSALHYSEEDWKRLISEL